MVPNHLYYDVQRSTIAGLLGRGALVRVAHFGNLPDLIQGWICFEEQAGRPILHYIYSRDPYILPTISEHFKNSVLGNKGLVTHMQVNPAFKGWKHCPEIARRKSL